MKIRKLGARGFAHYVALIAIVLVTASVGAYVLTKSHADSVGTNTTVSLAGIPCSVTAYAPTVWNNGNGNNASALSGVSCSGGKGTKSLSTCIQVKNGSSWYNASSKLGSPCGSRTTTANPNQVRVYEGCSVQGHVYRTVANGSVNYGGKIASATAISGTYTPWSSSVIAGC